MPAQFASKRQTASLLLIICTLAGVLACSDADSTSAEPLAKFRGTYSWQPPEAVKDPPGTVFGHDWQAEFYGYNKNKFLWRKIEIQGTVMLVNDGEIILREFEVLGNKILVQREDGNYLMDFSQPRQPKIVRTNEGAHPYEILYDKIQ